jgi:hypothetical protein
LFIREEEIDATFSITFPSKNFRYPALYNKETVGKTTTFSPLNVPIFYKKMIARRLLLKQDQSVYFILT